MVSEKQIKLITSYYHNMSFCFIDDGVDSFRKNWHKVEMAEQVVHGGEIIKAKQDMFDDFLHLIWFLNGMVFLVDSCNFVALRNVENGAKIIVLTFDNEADLRFNERVFDCKFDILTPEQYEDDIVDMLNQLKMGK